MDYYEFSEEQLAAYAKEQERWVRATLQEDPDPWWKWWLAQFPLLLFPLGIVLLVAGCAAWLADPGGELWKVLFAMVGVCWAAAGFLSIALW